MIIGVVGGGQLARMLALAGIPLGFEFIFLDPAKDACAAALGEHLRGAYDDPALLRTMAEKADVVTYEFENVPPTAIATLVEHGVPVFPAVNALTAAQDRLNEKQLFRQLDIPTAKYYQVDSFEDLKNAVEQIGLPAILKTRTLGYDGKGQWVLREQSDLESIWAQVGKAQLILESFVDFRREISIIGVRSADGDSRFYPLSENVHQQGILHTSRCLDGDEQAGRARDYLSRLLEHLNYVGVLTLELFDTEAGLVANEIAPRVHNSGHWTIEGAITSQFENHLRAVTNLPLGGTECTGFTIMVNFVGKMPPNTELLKTSGLHLHDYGKKARPGRKVGHATLWSKRPVDVSMMNSLLRGETEASYIRDN